MYIAFLIDFMKSVKADCDVILENLMLYNLLPQIDFQRVGCNKRITMIGDIINALGSMFKNHER